MSLSIGIRKDENATSSALFGVAAIQGLLGVFIWYLQAGDFGWRDWFVALSVAIYLVLGMAARWVQLSAALIGAGLYTAFLAIQATYGVASLLSGFIFKIPVVVLLFLAVVFAVRRSTESPP